MGLLDLAVIVVYTAGTLSLGLFLARGQATVRDYFATGRPGAVGRGDGLHRRDGDQHRNPDQCPGVRVRDRPDVPAVGLRIPRGAGAHHRAPAAGLLPGRVPHRLPGPRGTLRRRRRPPRRDHLPGDAEPRRRPPAHGRRTRARRRPPRLAGRGGSRRGAGPGARAGHHPARGVDPGGGRGHHRLHLPRRPDRGPLDGHGAARGVSRRLCGRGRRPPGSDPGGMAGGGRHRVRGRAVSPVRLLAGPDPKLHVLVGPRGRRLSHRRHPRHRSVDRAALPVQPVPSRGPQGAAVERRRGARAVRSLPDHRGHALRLLHGPGPGPAGGAVPRRAVAGPTGSSRRSSSPSCRPACAASWSPRSSRRRCPRCRRP